MVLISSMVMQAQLKASDVERVREQSMTGILGWLANHQGVGPEGERAYENRGGARSPRGACIVATTVSRGRQESGSSAECSPVAAPSEFLTVPAGKDDISRQS